MKLKDFLKILIAFAVISGCVVIWAVVRDYQKAANTNNIIDKIERDTDTVTGRIQAIIDSTVSIKKEEYPSYFETDKNNDISNIISDAKNESITPDVQETASPEITDETISNMKVLTSDTFSATQGGEERTFRLIGVKPDGNMEGLQLLLNSVTDPRLEFDTVQINANGVYLVYLWDGPKQEDCSNMINMQMILNNYASTTYLLTSDSVAETPNIKYSTTFIKYHKLVNPN